MSTTIDKRGGRSETGPAADAKRTKRSAVREHDLAELLTGLHPLEALTRTVHRQPLVDHGPPTRRRAEREQVLQLGLGHPGRTDALALQEEDPGQFGVRGAVAARGAGDDHRAAGL